jgi:cobyrinic acid a,c-diamide synthase
MKGLLIAGDRSGSGKTSITLALAALFSRSRAVQTFKVGMDYIDPSYLAGVTGRPCRNLDTFVMSREELQAIFSHGCRGADLALVEGVRGLYEGAESLGDTGTSASVAKALGLPVVLVVNARSITRSAAALVKGFCAFDPGLAIAGVIVNNVSGKRHIAKVVEAIEHYCGIPVVGAIPRMEEMELSMRHLGLVPFREGQEDGGFRERIERITGMIGEHVDLDRLLSLAAPIEPGTAGDSLFRPRGMPDLRIGVAYDEAFNFYYADLFNLLPAWGARVVTYSPLRDRLPDADGYIIGGGYPELFLSRLVENEGLRDDTLRASRQGVPIYAECGGLMYLSGEMVLKAGWNGLERDEHYPMCRVFEGKTVMPAKRVVSYVEGVSSSASPMGPARFRGHEFHYSEVVLPPGTRYAYTLERGLGITGSGDGAVSGMTIGSYTHLHPVSSAGMFRHFLDCCRGRAPGRRTNS